MENKKTLIGEYLGTIEEFVPGEGTYSEDGKIYAATLGKVVVDSENHKVKVVNNKTMPPIERGVVVFGEVLDIKKNAAIVIVRKIKGYCGDVDIKTGLFISNMADSYVERPEDAFAIGDIVKGVIIKNESGLIDISTKGDYGAVKSFCRRCRFPLEKTDKQGVLACESCGNKEKRKAAPDYGEVTDI